MNDTVGLGDCLRVDACASPLLTSSLRASEAGARAQKKQLQGHETRVTFCMFRGVLR